MCNTLQTIQKCQGDDCAFESNFEGDFGIINNKLLCYRCATKPNPNDPDGFSLEERKEFELTQQETIQTDTASEWFKKEHDKDFWSVPNNTHNQFDVLVRFMKKKGYSYNNWKYVFEK